eukprot:Blabericola_migrator_1__11506@NODE_686_length_6875_cov_181_991774_g499_i0_p4_GENE_NODE_686_length_6875_cov_181_991774_g499_i0NODE_686_length_6875_cov_181_991774_g499_i0_p4_ORF_typecomplete_len312_score57_28Glyco_transf_7C/PF02709_14/5_9e13Ricin_B_lectin/PF00652_22/1_4e12CDtoxinA/PF03498_14/9_2CDtoxinA/PF03498_14/0_00013Glyco_tranf_2_3/PF13641_6/0_00033Glyco_tranf_2_2/PF10111_9/0_0004RicinB_lectin_2/PF14200_6/1_9RicinB_lectin_2/PF14200_6/61ADK_lid/PF05191_14/0_5ADK_lid/PF05191_14/3_5e03ADK_lid/PF
MIEHGYNPDEDSTDERRNGGPTDFVSSPTMAGGLFAANVDFFLNDIGGYDEKFQYWGTENLELSFRLWQCGGRLECAPCSRVYHIFRKGGVGYSSPVWATTKNKLRTMAVWMDHYADLAWRVIGRPDIDFGTYDDLLSWRKQKKCKSFEWFLKEVNPESFVQEIPRDVPRLGPLSNIKTGECLISDGHTPVEAKAKMTTCTGSHTQEWMYFNRTQHVMPVFNDELCLNPNIPTRIKDTVWCYKKDNQWKVDEVDEKNLVQLRAKRGRCLAIEDEATLVLRPCDPEDESQLWSWPKYNPPKVWTPPPNRRQV